MDVSGRTRVASSTQYRFFVLAMLFLAYAFNYIDRVLLGIVQEPIKAEFGLSDFQIGLLGGPAFALLYTFLGIPIARIAERANRVSIIAIAMILWSGMTALCGLSHNYLQLLLARVGVSIGEAGLTPPAQSIIADYFPAHVRTTALGIYSLGVPAGALLAAFAGGVLAQEFGWRTAFVMLGLPGIALAIVIKLTVKEPPRDGDPADVPSLREALRMLMGKTSFRHLVAAASLSAVVTYGLGQYLTSFLVRAHDMALADASRLTGITIGIFAGVGTFLGGYLSDRLAAGRRGYIGFVPAVGLALATPLYMIAFGLPAFGFAIAALFAGALMHYSYLAPMYAIAQGTAAARMRATSVALMLLVVNLVGYGVGPPLVGAISDTFMAGALAGTGLTTETCLQNGAAACAAASAYGLRWALVVISGAQLWSAFHFWRAGRALESDWVG